MKKKLFLFFKIFHCYNLRLPLNPAPKVQILDSDGWLVTRRVKIQMRNLHFRVRSPARKKYFLGRFCIEGSYFVFFYFFSRTGIFSLCSSQVVIVTRMGRLLICVLRADFFFFRSDARAIALHCEKFIFFFSHWNIVF